MVSGILFFTALPIVLGGYVYHVRGYYNGRYDR